MSREMTKATKWHLRPAKTQLSAWRKFVSLATHWAHSKDTDRTGRMARLIWVFAGHTLILLICRDVAKIIQLSALITRSGWFSSRMCLIFVKYGAEHNYSYFQDFHHCDCAVCAYQYFLRGLKPGGTRQLPKSAIKFPRVGIFWQSWGKRYVHNRNQHRFCFWKATTIIINSC